MATREVVCTLFFIRSRHLDGCRLPALLIFPPAKDDSRHWLENREIALRPERLAGSIDNVLEVNEAGLAILADCEPIAEDQVEEGHDPLFPAIGFLLLGQGGPLGIPLGGRDFVEADVRVMLVGIAQHLLGGRKRADVVPEGRLRVFVVRIRVFAVQRNGRDGLPVDLDETETILLRFFDRHHDDLGAIEFLPAHVGLVLAGDHRHLVVHEGTVLPEEHDVTIVTFRHVGKHMIIFPTDRDIELRELLAVRHVDHVRLVEDQDSNIRLHQRGEAELDALDAVHVAMRREQACPCTGALLGGNRHIEIGGDLDVPELGMLPHECAHVVGLPTHDAR
ncbi:MAG: hypothetical protein JWN90_621 [Parcubacteria group bacterium]|nr:hypothetical protein [Parcubacteria group bacterium]